MKTDPAWDHGVSIDDGTTRVICNYCQRDFTGGAHRLKHHLAGTSRDIKSCKDVPDDVKENMEDIIFMNGIQKKMLKKKLKKKLKMKLKKKCIGVKGDVDEAEVAANSNEDEVAANSNEAEVAAYSNEDDAAANSNEADVAANSNKADVAATSNEAEVALMDMFKRVEDSDSMASKTESESPASKTESESPTDTPPSPPKNVYKDPDDGRQRFLLELEFVQCLANPTYIHYLAQNRYFEDEAFIGYLKYLQYWQRPEYIKFIMYPHCLYFLELLQDANFRNSMAHPANKELAHRQQFYFWKNYRNNRLKHILPKPLPEPTAALPASTQSQPPVPALPPPPPPPATNVAATSSAQSASPMPSGSGIAKIDTRNPTVDRRKRK